MTVHIEGLSWKPLQGSFCLKEVSFSLDRGSVTVITGANGSGKSTLLSLIAGRAPYLRGKPSGTLHSCGIDVFSSGISALFPRVLSISVRTERELFRPTVRQELLFPLQFLDVEESERQERFASSVTFFGLESILDQNPRHLSGGEQKLVALATAFAIRPELLCLDEPFSQLSNSKKALVLEALRVFAREGRTVVLSEHERNVLDGIASREIEMEGGQVVYDGPFRSVEDEKQHLQSIDIDGPSRNTPRFIIDGVQYHHRSITHNVQKKFLRIPFATIESGLTVLQGDNGTGKSTLLRLLRGLVRPERGTIVFDGKKIGKASSHKKMIYLPQDPLRFFYAVNGREQLFYGVSSVEVERLIESFSLSSLLDILPCYLSTGEQRRLALACALARFPSFMLLDELDAALDLRWRNLIGRELTRSVTSGCDVLIASHSLFLWSANAREIALEDLGAFSYG